MLVNINSCAFMMQLMNSTKWMKSITLEPQILSRRQLQKINIFVNYRKVKSQSLWKKRRPFTTLQLIFLSLN